MNNKLIVIEWRHELKYRVATSFSTPSGDPLIHISGEDPFFSVPAGWLFNKYAPGKMSFVIEPIFVL